MKLKNFFFVIQKKFGDGDLNKLYSGVVLINGSINRNYGHDNFKNVVDL